MAATRLSFSTHAADPGSQARSGRLETAHGSVDTPALIVPAPRAAVISLQPDEVVQLGGQAIAVSTYHLAMRPGAELLAQAGGVHGFSRWTGPVFADNGAFQLSRLGGDLDRYDGRLVRAAPAPDQYAQRRAQERSAAQGRVVKVDDDGVTFRSHLDGATHRWTPESFVGMQEAMNADIYVALAPDFGEAGGRRQAQDTGRSVRWTERALSARSRNDQALYVSVPSSGGEAERIDAARRLTGLPADGFALTIPDGRTDDASLTSLTSLVRVLPADRPRHLSGVGDPSDVLAAIRAGIDTFDSVVPARYAAHGVLLTEAGPLDIKRVVYREDDGPPDPACICPTCSTFTRAYLRHLFMAEELLATTLAVTHNLAFYLGLVTRIREAIVDSSLNSLEPALLAVYPPPRRLLRR